METVKLGMLGLGTVGSGVLEMIENNESKIRNIIGRELSVKTVVVRHPEKHQNAAADIKLTTEFEEVLNDNEIQIVVELIGGIHPAKEYIERLLKAHKSVVTANKDLIASYGPELAALAYENHCDLMYEASVAGGIPILRTIVNSFAADNILEVKGIVNGTTNYILTQMNQKHWTYDEALKKAQELGFAEADPTNDVTGKDAAYKMIILSYFAFGTQLKIDDFKTEGIDTLNAFDVSQAESLGYVIKLVGSAKVINGGVFVDVAPTLFNAVMVTGKAVGDTLFYGPGAGGLPTANSVLSDITSEVKNLIMGTSGHAFNTYQNEYVPADPDDVSYPYYLSLTMPDVSGQMLKFTKIMADVKASFSQIVQSPIKDEGIAHVAVITHELSQSQLTELKHQLHNADSIKLNAAYKVLEN